MIPGHIASGEFVEIDAPRRLVYTWGWERPNSPVPSGSTTVIFELKPHSNGTLLRFSHHDLPSSETVASHTHGWNHYLARLTQVATGVDPGDDPWVTNPMRE